MAKSAPIERDPRRTLERARQHEGILVEFAREAMLVVRDNVPGMGEERPGSSGLRLVRLLAGQISGRVDIDSSETGTAVTLTFPVVE